uniref:Galactose oxidase n=1 Tax=mine drainage metagenome TaxID=410659 RepID=E6PYP9_9ZZZZ
MKAHLLWNNLSGLAILAFVLSGCGGNSGGSGSSPATKNQWVWMGGANTRMQSSVYGTMGTPSPQNAPGARFSAAAWTDAQGNFWLYGGYGVASLSQVGHLSDMWEFSNGQWTWQSGSNTSTKLAVYGTMGTASANNTPGGRDYAATWTDKSGNFWLFSGIGAPNDLWKYANGQWTWMGGSNTFFADTPTHGVYGTMGQPSPGNMPGPRWGAATWTDSSGNLWMYGGEGYGASGPGALGDLWRYSNGMWTWMAGSDQTYPAPDYGQQGVAAAANTPGWRSGAATWADSKGNLWLFGGAGNLGEQNDLWKYSNGQWTWVSGSNQGDTPGIYNSEGNAGQGDYPGGRDSAVTWTDAQGNFWLFGGNGVASGPGAEEMNDLWEYSNGQWIWVNGSSTTTFPITPGNYGTLGVPAVTNIPPPRIYATGWIDKSGNLWLFGGASPSSVPFAWYNDLWKYTP